jgi:hypothetical protein
MSGRRRISWSTALFVAVVAAVLLAVVVRPAGGGQGGAASADDEVARAEIEEVVEAWALGGGTFGYPFWEKAGQRWTAGQISTTMYREYVTGYRDRMQGGCELLDAIDVGAEVAGELRSTVSGACSTRLEALRAQQEWLDALIELDTLRPDDPDPAATAERRIELQSEAAEQEERFRTQLQESYLATRTAMQDTQAYLDETGQERVPEDAFI